VPVSLATARAAPERATRYPLQSIVYFPESFESRLMSISEISTAVVAQMGGDNALLGMLPIILMFVVLYFLMIRPQMKRQKEHRNMVSALAKGDEVITAGGLVGKISEVKDNYVTLEIAQDNGRAVEVVMQRVAVQTLLPKGTLKSL